MNLPSSFIASAVAERDVLYFSSNQLSSPEPHYFICIKKTINDVLVFCVTSTQKEKIFQRISSAGVPNETIVLIRSSLEDDKSVFPKDCYVNCNTKFEFSVTQLVELFNLGRITIKGQLPTSYYEQIVNGLCLSPMIEDELKDLLNGIQ